MRRRETVRKIDNGIPRSSEQGPKVDLTAEVREMYRLVYQEGNIDALDIFFRSRELSPVALRVFESVLKAHLIKEQWEMAIDRPIPQETEIHNDQFFWADITVMLMDYMNEAQYSHQFDTSDEHSSLTLRALRLLRSRYPFPEGTVTQEPYFVDFSPFTALITRFYQAIEAKYMQETGESISGEQFYTAASNYHFTAFLLEWMNNDQPSGFGLERMSLRGGSDTVDLLDSEINLAFLERDPETNVVTFTREYIQSVKDMISKGDIQSADIQTSCPVMHTQTFSQITEWLARVVCYYRFQMPLPSAIQIQEPQHRLPDLLEHYRHFMSPEYRTARGITD